LTGCTAKEKSMNDLLANPKSISMTKEMAEVGTRDIALNWDVLVTSGIPAAISTA
jgi:hypothetical protein